MSVHNLKKYKDAKAILPHIDNILKVLNLSEKALTHYSHFVSVARILKVIKYEKLELENYKIIYESVRKKKGNE